MAWLKFLPPPHLCRRRLLPTVRKMAVGDVVYVMGKWKSPAAIQTLRRWSKDTGFKFDWAGCLNGGFVVRRIDA